MFVFADGLVCASSSMKSKESESGKQKHEKLSEQKTNQVSRGEKVLLWDQIGRWFSRLENDRKTGNLHFSVVDIKLNPSVQRPKTLTVHRDSLLLLFL